jgi:hypothetical protein
MMHVSPIIHRLLVGAALVCCVQTSPAVGANRFSLPRINLPRGATGQRVFVNCEHSFVVTAFSLSIRYDAKSLSVSSVSAAGTSAEEADFFGGTHTGGGIFYTAVFDMSSPFTKTLPPANNHTLAQITLNLLPAATAGKVLDLTFDDGFDNGHHIYYNTLTNIDGVSVSPSQTDGAVTVVEIGAAVPPSAHAGPDQVAAEETQVTLDASLSQSPSGEALSYSWEQASGPAVDLSQVDTTKPAITFVLPRVGADTRAVFRVTVEGRISGTESSDDVGISIIDMGSRTTEVKSSEKTQGILEDGTRVVIYQGTLTWDSFREDAFWSLLRFTATGAGDESTLLGKIYLYVDSNGNGEFDEEDQQLGSAASVLVNGGTVTYQFNQELEDGDPVTFFLVADIASPRVPQDAGLLLLPGLLALGAGLLLRRRRGRHGNFDTRWQGSWLLGAVVLCLLLPGFITACSSDGGGETPPAATTEVRFGILNPEDIGVQGLTTGVPVGSEDLPLEGPAIEV